MHRTFLSLWCVATGMIAQLIYACNESCGALRDVKVPITAIVKGFECRHSKPFISECLHDLNFLVLWILFRL